MRSAQVSEIEAEPPSRGSAGQYTQKIQCGLCRTYWKECVNLSLLQDTDYRNVLKSTASLQRCSE